MSKWVFSLFILCWAGISLCYAADNDAEIRGLKLSGLYYIGESSGRYTSATRDSVEAKLRMLAQQDLVLNIQSFVCATINQTDNSSATATDENLSKQMLISGSMIAGNIKYLVETESKKLKVFAYVSKAELASSEQEYCKRIQDTAQLGESKEKASGLSHALSLYYTAWLQSSFISSAIPYITLNKEQKQDIRAFLSDKLDACLREIKLSTHLGTPSEQPVYQIPVHITLSDAGSSDYLQLSLPAWSYENIPFKDQELTLYNQTMPSKSESRLAAQLCISPELVKSDPVLYNVARTRLYSRDTYLDLDYSPILKAEINYVQKDNLFTFEPVIHNLSISTQQWSFGDGSSADELSPKHLYSHSGVYTVSLLVNGSLKATRQVEVKSAPASKAAAPSVVVTETKPQTPPPSARIDDTEVLPQIIHELKGTGDYATAAGRLNQYKKAKKLLWGKLTDFLYPEKCWVLVFEPLDNKLIAVLSPGRGKRVEFISQTEVADFNTAYANKGVVCVQLN